jgi:hypothetical protein
MFTLDVNMHEVNPRYSHVEKELKTLEFSISRLAMLIFNVLS